MELQKAVQQVFLQLTDSLNQLQPGQYIIRFVKIYPAIPSVSMFVTSLKCSNAWKPVIQPGKWITKKGNGINR